MKKSLITTFIVVLSISSYSQIVFEKGYIILNSGNKELCLIKNMDWRDNPTKIKYKTVGSDEVKTVEIDDIVEFSIDNSSKYIRETIDIDRSTDNLNALSENRKPNFKSETLFLKTLVEGEFSLYEYTDQNIKRFFFSLGNQPIKQLVYKLYKLSNNQVGKNEHYKQQLFNSLKCSDISLGVKKLEYKHTELIKIFINYNKCKNSDFVIFEEKSKKNTLTFSVRVGLNRSSLSIQNSLTNLLNVDFDNELSFRIGGEVEYILPFNKNKWGIIIEPTYQYYTSKKTTKSSYYGERLVSVDYKSIEFPVGLRYYLFLKNKSKLFINASFIFDLSNSKIAFNKLDGTNINSLEIEPVTNFAFGLGYNINKYSLEFRLQTPQEFFGNNVSVNWQSDFKTTSLILGYNIFEKKP